MVLVVEDDEAIAEPLADGLRFHGFDSVVAGTGREALAQAGEADVVLLDLGLPDLDGLEAFRQLVERPGDRHKRLARASGGQASLRLHPEGGLLAEAALARAHGPRTVAPERKTAAGGT